jgi:hypothetical protein
MVLKKALFHSFISTYTNCGIIFETTEKRRILLLEIAQLVLVTATHLDLISHLVSCPVIHVPLPHQLPLR